MTSIQSCALLSLKSCKKLAFLLRDQMDRAECGEEGSNSIEEVEGGGKNGVCCCWEITEESRKKTGRRELDGIIRFVAICKKDVKGKKARNAKFKFR